MKKVITLAANVNETLILSIRGKKLRNLYLYHLLPTIKIGKKFACRIIELFQIVENGRFSNCAGLSRASSSHTKGEWWFLSWFSLGAL